MARNEEYLTMSGIDTEPIKKYDHSITSDMIEHKQEKIAKILKTKGNAVFHTTYGNGIIEACTDEIVTVRFDKGLTKRFSIKLCIDNEYLRPFIPSERQSKKWFTSLKWDDVCRECQKKNKGYCKNRGCAQMNYDEWGDPIPSYLYHMDGNDVENYLKQKRKQKAEEAEIL